MKTFFLDQLNLGRKTVLILVKTNQNLGQDRLILFPASKTAPPTANSWLRYWLRLVSRGGVLENVLGLEDTF